MSYELAFAGLLLSLAFTGLTGYYPGGIIVPSYLVLFANQPERIAGTLAAALLTFLCYRLAERHLLLFGRRRTVFMLLTGATWAVLWVQVLPSLFPVSMEFRVIGWIIPGLIANHFQRQGAAVTTAGLVTVVTLLHAGGRLLGTGG
ncbi:MAG: poly-gamma-glutamate biosynthesis protein PgsC [bacterium]